MNELLKFIVENYALLTSSALSIAWLIVRLTPSEKDNEILNKITDFIDIFIPNRKKGGGKFISKRSHAL